jgi:hypothetical protein
MRAIQNILLSMTCGMLLATPLAAQDVKCKPDPGRKPIKVSVVDGKPVVTPDTVSACQNETLRWVFEGSAAREFTVLFTSAADSPFDWDRQTGATVTGTVRSDAAKDGKQTPYDYDVEVGGESLDPRIIVEP